MNKRTNIYSLKKREDYLVFTIMWVTFSSTDKISNNGIRKLDSFFKKQTRTHKREREMNFNTKAHHNSTQNIQILFIRLDFKFFFFFGLSLLQNNLTFNNLEIHQFLTFCHLFNIKITKNNVF